jgi:SET domain-containing protein
MKKRLPAFARIQPDASPFRLAVRKSKIDRYGVFALEEIPAHRKIIEYTGKRFEYELKTGKGDRRISHGRRVYFFAVTKKWGVDGAIGGSGAELINHSCDPNIRERLIRYHILYFSSRRIRAGEELTIDYKFRPEHERHVCHCGAKTCRGTINLLPKSKEGKSRKTKRRGTR